MMAKWLYLDDAQQVNSNTFWHVAPHLSSYESKAIQDTSGYPYSLNYVVIITTITIGMDL